MEGWGLVFSTILRPLKTTMLSERATWEEQLLDVNAAALRRRLMDMAAAADCVDAASGRLLRFYALECGLKAMFMQRYKLKTTADRTSASKRSASEFKHNIDQIIRHIGIPPARLAHVPTAMHNSEGHAVPVSELHQAWRYGATVVAPDAADQWLSDGVAYVMGELR